jgi:hypothetical protein
MPGSELRVAGRAGVWRKDPQRCPKPQKGSLPIYLKYCPRQKADGSRVGLQWLEEIPGRVIREIAIRTSVKLEPVANPAPHRARAGPQMLRPMSF